MFNIKKLTSKILLVAMVAMMVPQVASAASLTSVSYELSTSKKSELANHTGYFVTPTGVAAGETITLTMSDFAIGASLDYEDMDLAEGDSGNCSSASFTDKTLAAAASGATWGAVRTSATVITFTSGTDTITAGRCVKIEVGTNATSGSTGAEQITNATTSGSKDMTFGGTMSDSGQASVAITDDPQVDVSALVATSLTLTLSSTSVDLGVLSSSSTSTGTTTVTVSTNASAGYMLKYNASELTNQNSDTIDRLTSETAASPGTEQWGLNAATVGNGSSATDATGAAGSAYDESGKYMAGTANTDTLFGSASGTASSHAYTVTYGVDIDATTPAGTYTGTVDYLVFGSF